MDPIVTRNLVRYLTGKRLIDRAGIVDGGMVLTMSRSRNRFVMLKQRGGPSYFIKQAIETEPGTRETIAREAEVYRGAFGDDRLRPLRDLLPAFRLYDAEQGILISDLVPSSETLTRLAYVTTYGLSRKTSAATTCRAPRGRPFNASSSQTTPIAATASTVPSHNRSVTQGETPSSRHSAKNGPIGKT